MRIILTGAKGNLGSYLQKLGPSHEWIPVHRETGSQIDQIFAQGCDMVLHAASDLLTPISKDPVGVVDSNINLTMTILRQMQKHGVKRLDFISSCAVYGKSQSTNEDQECAPISINGITKFLNEKIIQEFCTENNIEYRIFRIFNTFGGNDRFSILARLKNSLEEGKPFPLFNEGLSQRDFIYVGDVAQILLNIINTKLPKPILNIGSGKTVRIREIVDKAWSQNSKLEVQRLHREEAEYSRADITELTKILGSYSFTTIETYMDANWNLSK